MTRMNIVLIHMAIALLGYVGNFLDFACYLFCYFYRVTLVVNRVFESLTKLFENTLLLFRLINQRGKVLNLKSAGSTTSISEITQRTLFCSRETALPRRKRLNPIISFLHFCRMSTSFI